MLFSCWSVDFYIWFGLPYFYYDTYAMFKSWRYRVPGMLGMPQWEAFHIFVNENPLIVAHHIIFPLMFFPVLTVSNCPVDCVIHSDYVTCFHTFISLHYMKHFFVLLKGISPLRYDAMEYCL